MMKADKVKNITGSDITIEGVTITAGATLPLDAFRAGSNQKAFGRVMVHVDANDFEVQDITGAPITGNFDAGFNKETESGTEYVANLIPLSKIALNEYYLTADKISTEGLTLDEYKQVRYKQINARSGELIREGGFQYNGKTFSLRETAQLNLLGVQLKKDTAGVLPLKFNNIDDSETETLSTPTDVDNFFMAALVAKKVILDGGTTLKDQIRAATTTAEIDAIIDER